MTENAPNFFQRLALAFVCFFRVLFRPGFAALVQPDRTLPAVAKEPAETSPERRHASGLFLLSMLQREGRFIDFVEEDLTGFSDDEVGAAVRVVHAGCRRVLSEYFPLEPVLKDAEGASVTVPRGFDPARIRLTGNIAGTPPYAGSLKHHGWVTNDIRLPPVPATLDPRVLAPAEVELS